MRRVALAVVLACGALGVVAPAASALRYRLVASNGTTCRLDVVHHPTKLADGNYDVSFGAYLTCDGGQREAGVYSMVIDPNNGNFWGGSTYESDCYVYHQPCGTWTMHSDGVMRDVPSGDYDMTASVGVTLKDDSPDATGSAPVWVVTPPGCLPGSLSTGCGIGDKIVLR